MVILRKGSVGTNQALVRKPFVAEDHPGKGGAFRSHSLKENGGNKWILTSIEIVRRYTFAIPVYRKDTKNMTAAVIKLLRQFHDRFGTYPKLAQFDDDKEFYNVGVKDLLDKHNVKYFFTLSEKKAAVVERFNRTPKNSMWKYFYSVRNYKWTNVLEKLVNNYNPTKHSSIGLKPPDAKKERVASLGKIIR